MQRRRESGFTNFSQLVIILNEQRDRWQSQTVKITAGNILQYCLVKRGRRGVGGVVGAPGYLAKTANAERRISIYTADMPGRQEPLQIYIHSGGNTVRYCTNTISADIRSCCDNTKVRKNAVLCRLLPEWCGAFSAFRHFCG